MKTKHPFINKLRSHFRALTKLDRQAGATLIEVMVAVAIIMILMSGIGLAVVGSIDKANKAMALQDRNTMMMAISMYQLENQGKLPDALEKIASLLQEGRIPAGPWKTGWKYVISDDGKSYTLQSKGPDADSEDDDLPKPEDEAETPTANP